MIDLEPGLLRTFVAIVDHGGFGRAARRLNCTQSTASLHIRRLEEAAGNRLLDRGPRRLEVTPAGATLLGYARRLLALHDEARASLAAPALAGAVRVGVTEDFAHRQLPRALRQFSDAHPGVTLEVRSGLSRVMRQALRRREVDLLLARRVAGVRDGGAVLWRDPLLWVDASDAPVRGTPLPLVLFPDGCVYREHGLAALERGRRPWRIAYTSGGLGGVQAGIAAGLGISVLTRSALLPGLRAIAGLPKLPVTEMALYQVARPTPAVSALAAELEARLAA